MIKYLQCLCQVNRNKFLVGSPRHLLREGGRVHRSNKFTHKKKISRAKIKNKTKPNNSTILDKVEYRIMCEGSIQLALYKV